MIQISSAAATEIKRLQSSRGKTNSRFRLRVKTGGCFGLIYDMEIEDAKNSFSPGDRLLEINGVTTVIDSESLTKVQGLKIDYSEDLMGGGFRFDNPNVSSTCSCGQSFTIKQQTSHTENTTHSET